VASIIAWADERRRHALGLLAVGFLLPNVVYESYFWAYAALGEQIEQAYFFPARFMSGMPPHVGAMLRRARSMLSLRSGLTWESAVPLLFAAGVMVALWMVCRRPSRASHHLRDNPGLVYTAGCSVLGFVFLSTNYQGFPDRFFIEPYMAIAAAIVVAGIADLAPESWRGRCSKLFLVAAVASVAIMLSGRAYRFTRMRGLNLQYRAARNLAHDFLDNGTTVYAVGCTHLLGFNHVDNFSKFGFFFRGVDRYLKFRGTSELASNPGHLPDVVLVSRGKKRIGSRSWLGDAYQLADSSRYGRRKDLWVRKKQ